jgi:type IV pilus assembly protein PilE
VVPGGGFGISKKRNAMKKGYTLIEILITLLIIGVMAAILIPRTTKTKAKVSQREAESYLRAVRVSEKMFYARNGTYTACADAAAITATLGTVVRNGTYTFSVASGSATTFTATAAGGGANLTLDQDGTWTKGGSAYTPP